MATFKLVIRPNKISADGMAPVYIRITKNQKTSYKSTNIPVRVSLFDAKQQRVKGSHQNSARINLSLSTALTEAQGAFLELHSKNPNTSANAVKEKLKGNSKAEFVSVASQLMNKYESAGQIGTLDNAKGFTNKIMRFHGRAELLLHEINASFLDRYSAYCRTKLNNKQNTIHRDLRFIRVVINHAILHGLMEPIESPFLTYKLKLEKTTRDFLSEEEIQTLQNLSCIKGSNKDVFRDMFVFSCYAGGLRVSDVLLLKWNNFDGKRFTIKIRKTGEQLALNLPTVAEAIISKYSGTNNRDAYIFPVIKLANENDRRSLDSAISSATANINKVLKQLAVDAGITKNLSFHIARHSFATRALRKGIRIEYVSKLLGHSAIKETQIYAKIVNEALDEAMASLN